MPVERVSRSFKDISMSFQVNPLTNDIIVLKNEAAIARSIRNIISTLIGESPYSDKGSGVNKVLFDNMSSITESILQSEIENAINTYEPRVSLMSVVIDSDYDNYNYNITITYDIVGVDVDPQELNLVLETAR
jgi:phage baseplate assembly protein W